MSARPVLRMLRAAVFTAVCVTLSVIGHAWMSGQAVPWWTLAAASAGTFAVAYALAGRRRGYPHIAAAMLAGQAGMHELFSLGQGARLTAPAITHGAAGWLHDLMHPAASTGSAWTQMTMPPGMSMPPGMTMPDMPGMASMTSPHSGAAASMTSMGMGHGPWAMFAAHLVVGLACSWWLARGESSVFGLLTALITYALGPLRLAVAAMSAALMPRRRARVSSFARVRARCSLLLAGAVVRRGPPRRVFGI